MRVKTGTTRRARHQKTLSRTKGYRLTKSKLYKVAHEAELHAGQYAFAGRKKRKRDLRSLWITRINAGLSEQDLSYSQFAKLLQEKNIGLNRKILAHLANKEPEVFAQVVDQAKNKK